jgi:hypothetical protein
VGPAAPLVFGTSGLLNPLVALGPAAMLTSMGGTVGVLAAIGVLVAIVALFRFGLRRVRLATLILAVAATAGAATVADLAHRAEDDRVATFAPSPPIPAPAPAAPLPGGLRPLGDPLSVRNIEDFMLPDVRSAPVSAPSGEMPYAGYVAQVGGPSVDVRLLDARPRLDDEPGAAQVLAAAYAHAGTRHPGPDTAVVWLRVEADGGVAAREVLSATTPEAAAAARTSTPYLRYAPGEKDGVPYAAWVVQRFVFVP